MVEEVSDEAEVRQSSSSLLSAAASFRRPALTVAVLGAAAVIVVVARHTLAKSLHVLAAASPGWLLLALAAEAVSLTAFGMSRTLLLRVNGHRIGLGPVMAITYAAHALGLSIPFAGAELDVVYSYRQFRRAGLDAATTSWSMAVSWICSTASLALLLVAGAIAGSTSAASAAGYAGAAVYLLPVVGVLLALRFDRMRALLRSVLERLAALSKRVFGKPRGRRGRGRQVPRRGVEPAAVAARLRAGVRPGARDTGPSTPARVRARRAGDDRGAHRLGAALVRRARGRGGVPVHQLLARPARRLGRVHRARAPAAKETGPVIDATHRNTALLVAGCFFMEMLDGTIVITAAPQIGRSLGAPPAAIGLVVTAYLLTLATAIPLSGWLTRRLGNRVVFLTAIALFTLASIGCAASVSLGMLVGMRVLQGAGGAMMVPVGRTMVISRAAKEDLLRVTSYVVWPGLLAPVIAPLAGGLITTYASWHWMFLINVPLGVIAFCVAWRLVTDGPDSAASGAPPPLDWAGVVLTCLGLGGLTYGAHLVALPAPPALLTAVFLTGSVALLTAAALHLRRTAFPLLNLRTLGVPTFRVTQAGVIAYWLVCGAVPFLLPLMFQTQFGWSPVKSGAITAFVFAGNVAIKPATTPLINRFGFRAVLLAATVGTTVAVAVLGFTSAATPIAVIAGLALISGVTRSVGFTVYSTVGLADMPPELMRDANTLAATSTQLAGGLAIAVATVALRIGGAFGAGLTAYTVAFCLLALIAAGTAAEALRMDRTAGDAARRQRTPAPAAATRD